MADPVITAAALNKTAYAKGEPMVLTVVGSDPDEEAVEVTVQLRNKASGAMSSPVTVNATVDELEATAVDSGARTWTAGTRSGDTFTLTATA